MKHPKRMNELVKEGIFSQLLTIKKQLHAKGRQVIDLSVGSPDMPPMPHVVEELIKESQKLENYRYAISDLPEFRQAAARWYKRRFDVSLDSATQITSLLGSQEGLAHICLALTDAYDIVMVHDPGYPIYHAGPKIAQNELYAMPCADDSMLIDFEKVPKDIARKAKLMILSYPNNPTTQIADKKFYEEVVAFAKKYEIMVVHDNAYCELSYDGIRIGSFLQAKGATDIGIELNSLSKTYNLAGIRVGFALGNSDMIRYISSMKSHIDYGIFLPIQKCAIAALDGPQDAIDVTRNTYQKRRDILCDGLNALGWRIDKPKATMFVWAKLPQGYSDSNEFANVLAEKTGVIVTPGIAFGQCGEGYVRFALVASCEQMQRAVKNIKNSTLF